MKKETMSVHRALAELKLIDNKISTEINKAKFAGVKRKASDSINSMSVKDFKQKSLSSLQAIKDLIKRRDAIKSAVVLSNATTKVKVGDKEFTVAEAIDKKNTIENTVDLISELKRAYNQNHLVVENFNEQLNDEALNYFKQITENKDKLNDNAFKALVGAYKEEREKEVVAGFDVLKEQEELADELNEFLTNVDYILSESNTETKITIEY
jgi:hypothetical protein